MCPMFSSSLSHDIDFVILLCKMKIPVYFRLICYLTSFQASQGQCPCRWWLCLARWGWAMTRRGCRCCTPGSRRCVTRGAASWRSSTPQSGRWGHKTIWRVPGENENYVSNVLSRHKTDDKFLSYAHRGFCLNLFSFQEIEWEMSEGGSVSWGRSAAAEAAG